jgi:hypothetical protein
MDKEAIYIFLEVNSMASLGSSSSYIYAAEKMNLTTSLDEQLLEVASERYFGLQSLKF